MESGTPGVKSTRDGWLNRYLQVTGSDPSPLRGIAVARQMPRAMQGKAPSLAFGGVDAFDVRGGMDSRQSFEQAFSEADNPLLRGTAKDAFKAMETLRTIGTPYRPAARVSALAVRAGAAGDCARRQSRHRPRGGVRGIDQLGSSRQRGRHAGADCAAPR